MYSTFDFLSDTAGGSIVRTSSFDCEPRRLDRLFFLVSDKLFRLLMLDPSVLVLDRSAGLVLVLSREIAFPGVVAKKFPTAAKEAGSIPVSFSFLEVFRNDGTSFCRREGIINLGFLFARVFDATKTCWKTLGEKRVTTAFVCVRPIFLRTSAAMSNLTSKDATASVNEGLRSLGSSTNTSTRRPVAPSSSDIC